MLRLVTFGGLTLLDDGAPVTGAASQRSRLALLAVLAASGPAGIARDKLLALLWPESDDERARHALKQAVYALRRDLGNENAIAGTATLTLDSSIVASDVREFDDAIAEGDDARAVSAYGGSFLDGVFVRGAAEFDQWAGGERGRLEREWIEALARLARAAEARGDRAGAVQWWRKAAAAEPLSGRAALSLMRALAESGDVSAAIQHARAHDALVQAELESPADDAVLGFAEELKRGEFKPAARSAPAITESREVPPVEAAPVANAAGTPAPLAAPVIPTREPQRSPLLAVAACVVMIGLALAAWPRTRHLFTGGASSAELANQVVVSVFDNRTGNKTLDPLGMFATDVVVRALDHANFTVVDTRTAALATRWLATSVPAPTADADRATALANETGSGTVVTGSYYVIGDTLQFEASVVDVKRGVKSNAVGPFRGRVSDAGTLVGELAARVAAVLAARSDSTAGAATARLAEAPSVEAYEHTSRGWQMFFERPADTAAAFAELARAVAADSTYVAPYLMRAYILDVKAQWPELARLVSTLEPRREQMGRSEREALAMYEADLRGDLLGRLRAARELAQFNPGSSDMALLVAVSATYLNRAKEALGALTGAQADRGIAQVSPMYWAWRAQDEHLLGSYDAELASARQEVKAFPQSTTAPLAFVRAYAALGDTRKLNDVLAAAGMTRSVASADVVQLALLGARELRAHGHGDSKALFARVASLGVPVGGLRRDTAAHALALYEAGDYRAANGLFVQLSKGDTADLESLGRVGTSALELSDTAAARSVERRIASWSQPYDMGVREAWLAHFAALRGQTEDAIALLRKAVARGYRPVDFDAITLADEADFQGIQSSAGFRELVKPREGPAALP